MNYGDKAEIKEQLGAVEAQIARVTRWTSAAYGRRTQLACASSLQKVTERRTARLVLRKQELEALLSN